VPLQAKSKKLNYKKTRAESLVFFDLPACEKQQSLTKDRHDTEYDYLFFSGKVTIKVTSLSVCCK
jgi:hypothetical protein